MINDGFGYTPVEADLKFLGLTWSNLRDLEHRRAPLGMDPDDYAYLRNEVLHALERHGISDADVRLQGSSARFFSGAHKRLPTCLEDVAELVRERDRGVPQPYLTEPVWRVISEQWPVDRPRPVPRPFDSMHRAGLDPSPSDYDLQICSDQMIEIVRDEIVRMGYRVDLISESNPTYSFVRKEYAEWFFPLVGMACGMVAERIAKKNSCGNLSRGVTWALFASEGPPVNTDNPRLSSHLQDTDWIIASPDREKMAAQ